MLASFSFELLKLRKRPATWVIGGTLAAMVGVLGYLLGYLLVFGVGEASFMGAERFQQTLYPVNMVAEVLSILTGFGAAISLILGAMVVGGEYGWDTLKTALTQRLGRVRFFAGKLLAIAVMLAAAVLAAFAVGAGASSTIAVVENAPVEWPPAGELLLGAGAAWLVLVAWASVGAFLATLLRGTALAVGLGLVYALVLEGLIAGFSFASATVEKISLALLGRNSTDLGLSFGEGFGGGGPAMETVGPVQAALVLGAYVVVAVFLSLLAFRRRDVV